MNRIDKKKLQEITGLSSATVTRRLQHEWFIKATGAKMGRGKTNDKWTFDETKVRRYAAGENEPEPEEEIHEGIVEHSDPTVQSTALIRAPAVPQEFLQPQNNMAGAYVLLNKRFLTVEEAHVVSGLPKTYLKKQVAEKIGGRVLVRRSKLDEI